MRLIQPILTLSFVAALAACSGEPELTAEEQADAEMAQAEAEIEEVEESAAERELTVASSETLSAAQEFIDTIAQQGSIHVGMAKIAAEQASREGVKTFADNAIAVNQELLEGLKETAEDTAEDLRVETVLSEEQERNFAQLRGAISIDDMYLERTRASYDEVAGALANYAEEGEISALARWAEQASAKFDAHLADLRRL